LNCNFENAVEVLRPNEGEADHFLEVIDMLIGDNMMFMFTRVDDNKNLNSLP
jgi:hypothetical protein